MNSVVIKLQADDIVDGIVDGIVVGIIDGNWTCFLPEQLGNITV